MRADREFADREIARLQADLAELKQVGNEHYNNRIAVLETERDGYKARDKLRGEALEGTGVARGVDSSYQVDRGWHTHDCWRLWDNTALRNWFKCPSSCDARAAIDTTPEEAREKEE
jgi:hypothetical protein